MIAGVAGGLSEYFGVPTILMRLVWVLLLLPGGLPGLVPYLLLWLVVPADPDGRYL